MLCWSKGQLSELQGVQQFHTSTCHMPVGYALHTMDGKPCISKGNNDRFRRMLLQMHHTSSQPGFDKHVALYCM